MLAAADVDDRRFSVMVADNSAEPPFVNAAD